MSLTIGIFLTVAAVFTGTLMMRGRLVAPGLAETAKEFPPKPKWKPTIQVDLDRIEKTLDYYSNGQKSFVLFKYGTAVLVDSSSKTPQEDAQRSLQDIYYAHPDFNPQLMDDGDFSVGYSQPAYSIVFKDEFEKNREYIDRNHLDGLCPDEVLLDGQGRPNKFDDRGKIGLLARARMFMDAQSPVVERIHKVMGVTPSRDTDAKN